MSQPQTGKKIENYVFNYADFLGSGNFSKCYKAININTQEKVAIKIVELNSLKSKKLEELLFSEIAVLKQLNHPNVLRCIEVFTSNRNCYIITELCEEGDLEDRVKKVGKLEEGEIQKVIGDVLSGLLYLSSKGIVHRDLKIANIFMKEGAAKIADFGFAVHSTTNFKDLNIGSPLYMSPEGFLTNTYGPKTDIWSFGIMIYELYHKKTPFSKCATEKELKISIMTPIQYNELKSNMPEEAKELLLSCLQISEEKRPNARDLQNLAYFRQELKNKQNSTPNTNTFSMRAPPQLMPERPSFEPASFGRNRHNQKIQNSFQSEDHSRRFTSPPKTMPIPTAPLNSSLQFKPHPIRQVRNQSSQHSLSNNTFSFNFQSPQLKRNPVQEVKNLNMSVEYSPEPRRMVVMAPNNNRSQQMEPNSPLPPSLEKPRLINCQLNFKQSVSILHYCRLIFKYLDIYRGIVNLTDMSSNKHYCMFSQFLLQILNEMYQQIINKKVKLQGENMELREKKLIEVTSEYMKKYTKQLTQCNYRAGITDEEKRSLTITKFKQIAEMAVSGSILGQQCSNEQVIAGELLLTIYSATILFEYSFRRRSFNQFQKNRDIEDILNRNKTNFTFSSYLDHRNKVFNLPRA